MTRSLKYITAISLGIFFLGIFNWHIKNIYKYYRDTITISGYSNADFRSASDKLGIWSYLAAKSYIHKIAHVFRTTSIPSNKKKMTVIDNARIGEALGFLSENVNSQ